MAMPAGPTPESPRSERPFLVNRGTAPGTFQPWTRWSDWATLLIGIWFFISPWVLALPNTGGDNWNQWLSGAALVILSAWLLSAPAAIFLAWLEMALAVWIFISPWVLDRLFARVAWNDWATGVVVFLLALWTVSVVDSGRTWFGYGGRPGRRRL